MGETVVTAITQAGKQLMDQNNYCSSFVKLKYKQILTFWIYLVNEK